jgi:hypothetical protein
MAAVPTVKADPIAVTSGGFSLINLGKQRHRNTGDGFTGRRFAYDTHNINGNGSFTALLNPLTFTTGFTGFNSGGDLSVHFSQLLTINGQTQVMNLAGNINIGHLVDTVLSSRPIRSHLTSHAFSFGHSSSDRY